MILIEEGLVVGFTGLTGAQQHIVHLVRHGIPRKLLQEADFSGILPNSAPTEVADSLPSLAGSLDCVRFATILFADIVGSTQHIRVLDPEQARDLIDGAIALIKRAIHEFDGLVIRVQGDGVMAVFGIHPAAQDHALRAALAARRIVDRMAYTAIKGGPSIRARVGIHAGPILLRRQEHDFGSIIDVVGHAAHAAGQIEKLAPSGSVAVSAATASLIAENCDLRQVGKLRADGDELGESVFELAAVNFAGSDCVPVKGNTTYPVIGRDSDLEKVRAMIAALPAGQSNALGFIGDAGMGKSRLLLEASRLAAGYGVTFIVIRGNALMASVPFGCLTPAVRHLLDLLRPFCPDPAREAALSPEQTECLDGFIESNSAWLPDLTPGDRSRIATKAIVSLMRLAVNYMPLLILVDDLHYIDRETRSVLSGIRLVAPLGMIAAGRPEAVLRITTLCGKPKKLEALSQDKARALVSLINRSSPLEDTMVAKILARADGLPLAIQEFAVAAQSGDSGNRLPARLENLLAERLTALDEDALRLCQLCAALGPSFPAQLLAKGAALVCRDPMAATARLVASRVIETAQADIVRFTHQLVQETAYTTMVKERRTAMHARVLELLDGDVAAHAELAIHAEKAGMPERALKHLWNACEEALGLAAVDSMITLYHRALDVTETLDPATARLQRARFALLAVDTLQQLSLEQEARDDIHAVASGQIDMGPSIRTIARINMALLDRINGAPDHGARWLAEAEADLDVRESVPRRTFADTVGAYIAYTRAKPDEAIARIERLSARLDADQHSARYGVVVAIPRILTRSFGAWYSVDLGDFSRARQWIAEALQISRRYSHDYSRLLAKLAHGYLHYRTGQTEKALAILRPTYAACLRHRFQGYEPVCAGWLALCHIEQGQLDEAASILGSEVKRNRYQQVRTSATYYFLEARARLAVAQGNAEEAKVHAENALSHCLNYGEQMHELHALVLRKEVCAAFGEPIGSLDELHSKVTALGIQPLIKRLCSMQGGI